MQAVILLNGDVGLRDVLAQRAVLLAGMAASCSTIYSWRTSQSLYEDVRAKISRS
jgi:hypothetical protein